MSHTRFIYRETTPADQQFLAEMLIEATQASGHLLTLDDLPSTAESYRYVADWGKPSDLGVIAHDQHGIPVGAAWARLFDRSAHRRSSTTTPRS
ncbi:hypothetical protein [Nocardia iowensis]|uniref:Acetyltransferase n=1 Tax=Nocardia iowensis TaxID=204891 RepID=A0ABX8RL53_NOCIO|nr:hypothetical protein [Nocardia iowensis]QXN88171.1 hypothetical protein KV110_21375 [Nocardia iowensis]